ncbi:MAG: hypothetical protein ACETWR_06680 [Anaerolineae bacterium]
MMIQQSDCRPIRRELFLLLVATLILFGSGGCVPVPTPTPVDTLAPSPTASPKLTDTFTPPPTETLASPPTETSAPLPTETPAPPTMAPVTPTPTVEEETGPTPTGKTLEIPLGIGIWDADNVAFFNRYAREQDIIAARLPFMEFLDDVEVGQKMLVLGPRDEEATDIGSVVAAAKAKGATMLGYNLETALPKEELISKEKEMQRVAGANDLRYAFGPTLGKLLKYYDDFARHADIIVLQSQRFQTTKEYEERVEELIGRIRSANPEVKVWVQVSVNPPEKRDITPDEVVSDIQLIADQADLIWIFFAPEKASTMEEVFKRFR